jgi:hypothetical protein
MVAQVVRHMERVQINLEFSFGFGFERELCGDRIEQP